VTAPAEVGRPRTTTIAAAVLAGGASRRMGTDKRTMEVGGRALLARAVDAVAVVADEVSVVAGPADAGALAAAVPDVRVHVDEFPGEGPLGGLVTALSRSAADVVLVVAGDHPALSPDVLASLVAALTAAPDRKAAVLGTDHGPNPLVGAYRRDAAATLRALFRGGERRALAVVDHLPVVVVPPTAWRAWDPSGATATDLDTPDDLAAYVAGGTARSRSVLRVDAAGAGTEVPDRIVREAPLELRVAGPGQAPTAVLTTLRTPGNDRDLALGWLVAEGLLDPASGPEVTFEVADPLEVAHPEHTLTAQLPHPLDLRAAATRRSAATASCGVCGRASIDELAARCRPVPAGVPDGGPLPWDTVAALPDRLRDAQGLFAATGGLHATGLADRDGDLVTVREDVGRHNALDAAIGVHVRRRAHPLHHLVAVLSGRVGFELVAKAAVAGLPVVVAVGAPTDLAIATADRLGVTLVGFLRDGAGNVYSHPHRLALRTYGPPTSTGA
jgi:FdhD protein